MKRFKLSIIGQSFDIDVERQDDRRFYVAVNNKRYEALLQDDPGQGVLIAVDGGLYSVELEGEPGTGTMKAKVNERYRLVESKGFFGAGEISIAEKAIPTGTEEYESVGKELKAPGNGPTGDGIVAPLPGKVVAVKVNVGDEISAGDVVVILEAMKMENEIVSNRDGRVTEIRVKEGDTMDTNDVLVVVS